MTATAAPTSAPTSASSSYSDRLLALAQASVERHFEPYVDIAWDAPEFAVTEGDRRWILSASTDPLGQHPWYQGLPEQQQIAIGMWRQANVAKVGLQFEQVLINGMMNFVGGLPNNSAEARYCTHEMIEECNHTLMFQEMVNRVAPQVPGAAPVMRALAPFIALVGRFAPTLFFVGILAGEEPIDHLQKSILRAGEDVHPIMHGVMRIHVAEEARHISFAHEFLRHHVPQLNRPSRWALSVAFPVIMRGLCDVIVVPPKQFWDEFDIPADVKKDLFWRLPESRRQLSDYFADVRALAEEIGLMNPVSRRVWKLLKIDGRTSRYRSEPVRTVPAAA
ncbi:MAG: AurF N-oxygenase family protein [Jatrophihabitans sp.]|uniref:AurF N-oxygenase family protein n=1 Tax=Jatrophihabitans sp. TaxID=1932789 RepID=UPI003F7DEA00